MLPQTQLVITEGNYLLLDDGPWAAVAPLLDEAWYIEVDEVARRARLVRRHQQFGRSAEEARAWEAATDQPNAVRIEATRARANAWSPGAPELARTLQRHARRAGAGFKQKVPSAPAGTAQIAIDLVAIRLE